MMKFATSFVKLDKRGDMCCALLDTICEDQDLRLPGEAAKTIERLEAQLTNLAPMRSDGVREAMASLIYRLVSAAGPDGLTEPELAEKLTALADAKAQRAIELLRALY